MMAGECDGKLLDIWLDSWDRNNTILLNLLRSLPPGGLDLKAIEGSPSVVELFNHMHYVRLAFVAEDAPELARPLPAEEWSGERDPGRLTEMLKKSGEACARQFRDGFRQGGRWTFTTTIRSFWFST
jgi:hypothetical protein